MGTAIIDWTPRAATSGSAGWRPSRAASARTRGSPVLRTSSTSDRGFRSASASGVRLSVTGSITAPTARTKSAPSSRRMSAPRWAPAALRHTARSFSSSRSNTTSLESVSAALNRLHTSSVAPPPSSSGGALAISGAVGARETPPRAPRPWRSRPSARSPGGRRGGGSRRTRRPRASRHRPASSLASASSWRKPSRRAPSMACSWRSRISSSGRPATCATSAADQPVPVPVALRAGVRPARQTPWFAAIAASSASRSAGRRRPQLAASVSDAVEVVVGDLHRPRRASRCAARRWTGAHAPARSPRR